MLNFTGQNYTAKRALRTLASKFWTPARARTLCIIKLSQKQENKPTSCRCASSCRVPDLSYDWKTHSGRKFNYFSYGSACSEVEIDCLTGDHQVRACSLCIHRYPDLTCSLEHNRTLCKREIYEFAWQCDDPLSQATGNTKTKLRTTNSLHFSSVPCVSLLFLYRLSVIPANFRCTVLSP